MEIWKEIPSTEGRYEVSNLGRIKRNAYTKIRRNGRKQSFKQKILSTSIDSHGYAQACYYVGEEKCVRLVHRLVAEAFLAPPSQELIDECLKAGHKVVLVNHKDKVPLNNRAENLEWCTPAYNNEYSPQDYSHITGSNCQHAVLNESDVDKILELRGKMSQQKIANIFGVKQVTISNIFTGRSWSSYTGIPRKERRKGKAAAKTKSISE